MGFRISCGHVRARSCFPRHPRFPLLPVKLFRYAGPNGHPSLHQVVYADKTEIITWSEPYEGEIGGETWMGSPAQFRKEFREESPT